MTIHSSFERELILEWPVLLENGVEHRFLTANLSGAGIENGPMLTPSESFRFQYLKPYVETMSGSEWIRMIPNGFDEKRFRPISHENGSYPVHYRMPFSTSERTGYVI